MPTPTSRRRSDGAKPTREPRTSNVQPRTSNAELQSESAGGRGSDAQKETAVTTNSGTDHGGLVQAGDRPADIVAFERQVVSFFVDAADLLGVPKSVAAIYGICFASLEPLSFSDIDERLDISSGSISQGLRVLKEVGALKVADEESVGRRTPSAPAISSRPSTLSSQLSATVDNGEPDREATQSLSPSLLQSLGRRHADRYEPDLELRKLILRWLENRLQNELKSGQSRLKKIMASVPPSLAHPDSVLHARFESLQTWHDKAASLLPIAKTFLKLT